LLCLFVADGLLVGLAFRVAYYIRFELMLPIFQYDGAPSLAYYQTLMLYLVPVWLAGFIFAGLYQRQHLLGGTDEYARLFRSTTISLLVVIVAGFLGHGLVIARGWLMLAWGLTFLFAALGRFWLRRVAYGLRQRGIFLAKALIVGANVEGCRLAEQLADPRSSGLHLVGFIDEKIVAGTLVLPRLPALGNVEQLGHIIEQYGIEEIILAASAISTRNNLVEVFRRYGMSSDVTVHLSSGLYEIITTGLTVNQMAYVPFVGINKVRLTGVDWAAKSLVDFGLALSGFLVTWPLFLLIALAVKLDSRGPVLYRRRVMGVNGKQFNAFKFRTMHVNGDEILAAQPALHAELVRTHKLKDDPRITRVGRWLRKFSLDELPQVFNVLRGEMSLVGPRMISPPEMAMYSRWGMNLLTVKPGITGLWQVSGRSDISYEERVRLDMHYIRNWNIWLDLQLLFQTIPVVIHGHGAY
jgi:exopolysaccharide biosynthesis polyprenyl glycosylphosphotransferase